MLIQQNSMRSFQQQVERRSEHYIKLLDFSNYNINPLITLAQLQSFMNLNIYRRHKSTNLQSQRKQKILHNALTHSCKEDFADQLLIEAKKYYYSQKDQERAVEAFERYLERFPSHDEALYLCGVSEVQLNKYYEAIERFDKISNAYSLKRNALLFTSIAYNKLGLVEKSYETACECIKKYPQFEQAICFRAKLNLQMNDYLKAELDFQTVVSLNSNSYLGLIGLGDCCRYSNQFEKAFNFYHRSIVALNLQHLKQNIIQKEVSLKIATCLYFLEKYKESYQILKPLTGQKQMECSQLYYYFGLCLLMLDKREEALNHLQHSIRLETNPLIVEKAFKKLLISYLQGHHFYEAQNIIKMGRLYNIYAKQWSQLIEAFILAIKEHHSQALKGILPIYEIVKPNQTAVKLIKIVQDDHDIDKLIMRSQGCSNLFKRKGSFQSTQKRVKIIKRSPRKLRSTEKANPITKVKRSFNNAESLRLNINGYQSFPLKLGRFKTEYQDTQVIAAPAFSEKEKEIIYPMLLQFKAYCEFFTNEFVACIETYDEYEAYIQNHFGKDFDFKYSRALCEILLLVRTQVYDEALLRCNQSIELHQQKYGSEPLEPLLYKISILIKTSINNVLNPIEENYKQKSQQILIETLQFIQNKPLLDSCSISHYYAAFIFILVDDYQKSRKCLQTAVEESVECTPNMLYSKGLVEMKLGCYITAFKDFTAAIIIKRTAKSYLARAITLFWVTQNNQSLGEELLKLIVTILNVDSNSHIPPYSMDAINKKYIKQCILEQCLDDLQKYIEYCDNEQELALWVTKLLFATQSYDEAIQSLKKATLKNNDIIKITNCLNIYSGDFDKGGKVGHIIKQSFEGKYLNEQEQKIALESINIKHYKKRELDYLEQSYEKWMIILHLYVKEKYALCIQYIQKVIIECKQEDTMLLLRYDLALLYFLTHQYEKGINVVQSLRSIQQHQNMKLILQKIIKGNFENDECLSDLKPQLFARSSKTLSSYLSYKPIYLFHNNQRIKVHVRINIPFPAFFKPNLDLEFDLDFIINELDITRIPKKIEAPWIKRVNKTLQFTEKLYDTITSFESKTQDEFSFHLPIKQLNNN